MRMLLLDGSPASLCGRASHAALSLFLAFTLTACGSSSGDKDKNKEAAPAPTVELSADPNPLPVSDETTLTWVVTDATECTATGGAFAGPGKDASGGTQAVSVSADTDFSLECTGPGGTASDSVAVTVDFPPTVSLTASPNPVTTGNSTELTWVVTNATQCTATGGAFVGNKAVGGASQTVTLIAATTTYQLECTGAGGTTSDAVEVNANVAFTSQSVEAGTNAKQLRFLWTVGTTVGVDHFVLEVNPDGVSGFSQVDLNNDGALDPDDRLGATAENVELTLLALHFTDFNNARYQIVARDAGDSELARSADLFITDIVVEELIGYFKASNTDANDRFGISLSLSADANTLAVGALGEDSDATGIDGDQGDGPGIGSAGAVYIFRRSSGDSWSQEAYVKASNTGKSDNFGGRVSLSADGNTLAVGAAGEESNATGIDGDQNDDSLDDAGAVYLFVRSPEGDWSQQAYVKASNTDAADKFGDSVSLSADGNTLAVGAPFEESSGVSINGPGQSDNSGIDHGAVYLFVRSPEGDWSQQAYVKASNTNIGGGGLNQGDKFGTGVSLSGDGNSLAVGAPFEESTSTGINRLQSNNDQPAAGAVYAFRRFSLPLGGFVWFQEAYLKASNTGPADFFGFNVSFSADASTLAVGAWGENSNATGIDGDQNDDSLTLAGAVYVFARSSGGAWSQEAYVKASNPDLGDEFGIGTSLSTDGNTLAVLASGEKSNATGIDGDEDDNSLNRASAVYVFVRGSEGAWSQEAYVKAPTIDAFDSLGSFADRGPVALSGDGNMLAFGASGEESNATGIDGDQSDNSTFNAGAVYLY